MAQVKSKILLASWLSAVIICICLTSTTKLVSCGPNLRAQTNSESSTNNANNAPYLLANLKQENSSLVSGLDQHRQSGRQDATVNAPPTAIRLVPTGSSRFGAQAEGSTRNKSIEEDYGSSSSGEESEPQHFSVIKEETVEEIVDLEPESALKLTPESGAVASSSSLSSPSSDNAKQQPDLVAAETMRLTSSQEQSVSTGKEIGGGQKLDRKPQLPVTSSHLKRPALGVLDDEQESVSAATGANETSLVGQKSGGAKSFVSPSVATENEQQVTSMKKRLPSNLPDVLAPEQIMAGVTNVSNVPAIVSKEYGHQTRTRITLGGGYVRDRLPPLTKPGSGVHSAETRPEKPIVPLEKPKVVQSSGEPKEVSRVIEIPERIVLKPSVQKLDEFAETTIKITEVSPAANESISTASIAAAINKNALGALDSRCPKSGVSTFGHATACDRYYYCEDGYLSEQVCPNGLMYGTRDSVKDYCVHRWKADCEDKTIPNPISSPGCRWQYGVFNVQGSPKCSPDFYECTAGKFEVKKCSIDGQVYDDRTKSCQFAEQVGCAKAVLADFQCPPDDQANTYWPFPRYFFNERALIHCVNDKPEIIRCTEDQRVDPEHLHCIPLAKWNQQHGAKASLDARKSREKKKVPVQ